MKTINIVTLTGRLVRDCQYKVTSNGLVIANFSIAHNRYKKEGAEWVKSDTSFYKELNMERVELSKLQHGAVCDLFDVEMDRVLKNIEDENTQPDRIRTITIKIAIKPDKTRRTAELNVEVKSSLANVKPSQSLVFFDTDGNKLSAYEEDTRQSELPIGAIKFSTAQGE